MIIIVALLLANPKDNLDSEFMPWIADSLSVEMRSLIPNSNR